MPVNRHTFVFVILSLFFLPLTTAKAQSAVSYRFLEVVDSAGKPVVNAKVETNTSTQQTDENGAIKKLPVYYGDSNTTRLKVSKPGYFTYEENEVIFSYRYQYLLEGENIRYDRAGPIKIELLRIPVTAAERQGVEGEQHKRELLLASKQGDAATLRRLLQAGVDVNTADVNGIPAILWAVTSGVAETISALLAAGAEPGPKALLYYLHYASAISDEVVRALLKAATDINAADDRGQTALILAAASGASHSEEALKMLLESGASINAKDNERGTALMAAIGLETVEKVKLLLDAGADVNAADSHRQTALILAAASAASHSGKMIKMLLESGASINAKDNEGRTALMVAIGKGFLVGKDLTVEKVKLLLAAGADVYIQDNQGQTALMIARKSGDETVAKLLEAVTRP